MLSSWVVLAILAGLLSNAFNTLCRYFLKDKDDAAVWAWFFEAGRLVIFSVVVLFDFSIRQEPATFFLLLLVGLTELGGSYFTMKMHAYTHLSISTILSRTRMIWIPIVAFFFLREHLLSSDYVGIFVLFLGVSITVAPRRFFVDKGAMYANVAAFILAFNTIVLKAAIPQASYSTILLASAFPSVVFLPAVIKNARRSIVSFARTKLWLKIAAILMHVGSIYFFLAALDVGEVSKVNAIYQGMLVTSVFFGIIFFKEREDILKKCIGAAVTIVGILMLIYK
ncbi:MAG: EamA family transporter [Candidatus Levybacteria bacterium]|nr:EamA family transporter [Candidatus Levybacteria bacterium]